MAKESIHDQHQKMLIDFLRTDSDPAFQLFSNLLGNALTYGSADRAVRVRAISDERGFELSVSNAGNPIRAVALEHPFQPFYRSAVMHNREGLGLGLYISHEIATAHGGTLEVASTQEETTFCFRMPTI